MIIKKNLLIFMGFGILFLFACQDGERMQAESSYQKTLDSISWEKLAKLAGKKIYFGHQSVGLNIIDGVNDILSDNGFLKLNIEETSAIADPVKPIFAHSRVGQNRDYMSKINDFSSKMENGLGEQMDVAFFKFCYVDITAETDVQDVFNAYTSRMDRLQDKCPETVFLHATVPLKAAGTTWKTKIKKFLGKENLWEYEDNIARNEFNQLIRHKYGDTGRLFDIANAESTDFDGSRAGFQQNGNQYNALIAAYTYDGGHLNETGRKIVAIHLLNTLANSLD